MEAPKEEANPAEAAEPQVAELIRQPGDGSCLFHSLAYGLSGRSSNTKVSRKLRLDIANFIREHPEHKIAGVTIADWVHLDSELSVDAYSKTMTKESSWGGALEIAVCGILKGVNIHVYEAMDDGGKYN